MLVAGWNIDSMCIICKVIGQVNVRSVYIYTSFSFLVFSAFQVYILIVKRECSDSMCLK